MALGTNCTLMVQLLPTRKLTTQPVLLTRKSPVVKTRVMFTAASPVLVTWIVKLLVLAPTAVSANVTDGGSIASVLVWVSPVPVVVKLWTPTCVLSAKVTLPVRVPAAVGVKVTLTKQACPGLRL